MKKVQAKITFLTIATLLSLATITTGCSSDDNNNISEETKLGRIDAAVGTYKGRLTSTHLGEYEHFNAIVTVTKVDDTHLKVEAKSGEAYSSVTSKVFKVETIYNNDIRSAHGILEGYFSYYADVKTIDFSTSQQSETELNFAFEGIKQ